MLTKERLLAVSFCLGTCAHGLLAQMSGSYTINPTGSGSRNFKTIQGAVDAAWKVGGG